jgi:peptidoglycan/LPS O-acetylase OafA/YrhL/lysophospholipase L1-like esterase
MPKPVRSSQRYLPGLDGLRAIAVLAVIAFHEQLSWAPGGLLGVGVFFTLSGYLITDLLLGQWRRHGRLRLADFWLRRARRLLPALFVMLAVVTAWVTVLDPSALSALRGADAAAAGYVSNWYYIASHASYFSRFAPPGPLDHLWSLAVEEQFYLVWPWLLWLGVRCIPAQRAARLRWLALPTLLLAGVSTVVSLLLYHPGLDPTRVYEGTDTRASGLLIGAALAMVWSSQRAEKAGRSVRIPLDAAGVMGLAVIGLMIWRTGQYSPFLYRGGLVLLSVATAAVVAAVAAGGSRLGAALGWRPLRWLGVRSYGIYLWHYPVIVLTTPANSGEDLPRAAAQVAASVTLAALSWRFIEEPVRHGAIGRLWAATPLARHRGRLAAVATGEVTHAGAGVAGPVAGAGWAGAGSAIGAASVTGVGVASVPGSGAGISAGSAAGAGVGSAAGAGVGSAAGAGVGSVTRDGGGSPAAAGSFPGTGAHGGGGRHAGWAGPDGRQSRPHVRRSARHARPFSVIGSWTAVTAASGVLVVAGVGLAGLVTAPTTGPGRGGADQAVGSSLPPPPARRNLGAGSGPTGRAGSSAVKQGNQSAPSKAGGSLRTSCRSVTDIGDSTSEGMVSPDYLPNPAQRLPAQYRRVGVRTMNLEISGARSIVETLPGQVNGYNVALSLVHRGFRGCWVLALGTNDTADVAVGSNVGLATRIQRMMSVAHGEPVLWINVISLLANGPYSEASMQRWNAALLQACSHYPNMRVYNWAAVAQRSWFISDGIHYTSVGYAARGRDIANALAQAFPAVGHSRGCLVNLKRACQILIHGYVTAVPWETRRPRTGVVGGWSVVGVLRAGELPADNLLGKRPGRPPEYRPNLGVALHELCRVGGEPGHVLPDEHLGIAVGTGADPDRRDVHRVGDAAGKLGRHTLQHDGERAGGFEGLGVMH